MGRIRKREKALAIAAGAFFCSVALCDLVGVEPRQYVGAPVANAVADAEVRRTLPLMAQGIERFDAEAGKSRNLRGGKVFGDDGNLGHRSGGVHDDIPRSSEVSLCSSLYCKAGTDQRHPSVGVVAIGPLRTYRWASRSVERYLSHVALASTLIREWPGGTGVVCRKRWQILV